jgi:hypothetical protein
MPEHLPHNQETQDPNHEAVEVFAERLNLKEQYLAQVKVLYQSGILENFLPDPEQGRDVPEMGIVGIDGKEYIMPSYEDILDCLKDPEKRKLIEKKVEQGFTKLLLVPFAMPLSVLIQRYKDILLKTNKETGIKATDGSTLELNENDPIYVWEDLVQCDNPDTPKDKQIEYGVKTYDAKTKEERGGQYKSELLQDPDNAWQVLLLENNPDLLAENKGQTITGRKQLEANQSPKAYLKLLQTREQYQGESGLTPEANLTLYLDALTRNQTALDDRQGQGKANYLVGNYLNGYVPYFRWYRDDRRPFLFRDDPDDSDSDYGCRPSVEF